MPYLTVAGISREIDAIVFDKDGTLIDFDLAWGGRLQRAISAAWHSAGGDANLKASFYRALGADAVTGAMAKDGPYVAATIVETCTIAASVLYQAGHPWHWSVGTIEATMRPIFTAPPMAQELAGIGDVAAVMARLKAGGLRLAVATNDERAGTLAGLEMLGIGGMVDAVVSADDAGIAPKPSGDGILHIARTLGVPPGRMAVVGDAAGDLQAGRAAGAGLVVGVLSGPATRAELQPLADVIIADVHGLTCGPVAGR